MNKKLSPKISEQLKNPLTIWILVLFVGVLANAILFVYSYIPQTHENRELQSKIELLELTQSQMLENDMPEAITDEAIEQLLQQVPMNDDIPNFILTLKEIERNTGMIIQFYNFAKDGASEEGLISEKGLSLSLSGTYSQLIDFIEQLNQLDRITTIQNWEISVSQQAGGTSPAVDESIIEVSMLITIYQRESPLLTNRE